MVISSGSNFQMITLKEKLGRNNHNAPKLIEVCDLAKIINGDKYFQRTI